VIGLRRRSRPAEDGSGSGPQAPAGPTMSTGTIDRHVTELFGLVPERLAAATRAFLVGDRAAAAELVASEPAIDSLQIHVEELIQTELLRRPPSDDLMRFLVTVLRIVPELERSADLVEHIALRAQPALLARLTPTARQIIDEMGRKGAEMWRIVGQAFAERDASAAALLAEMDDDLDDLHVQLTHELAGLNLGSSAAIELGLVARFLERLGDHAVNVARRMTYCLPGS
jgi:phosphate transport system protein